VGRIIAGAGGFFERQMDALADFLNAGGHNRSAILGMAELEVHAAADVAEFQHGASPGRTGNRYQHGFGAELGMSGNQRLAFSQEHGGVAMMLGLDLKHRGRRQISQRNSALDFRADDVAVYFVAEIRVRCKHVAKQSGQKAVERSYQRKGRHWQVTSVREAGIAKKAARPDRPGSAQESSCGSQQLLSNRTGYGGKYVVGTSPD